MTKRRKKKNSRANFSQGLPRVEGWRPKRHPSETLDSAYFRRCKQLEREMLARVAYEKQFNEHNFDSGWAVEEIFRHALRELLPRRYAVQAGSISDSRGFSAGDCDAVIFNDFWFPVVKSGPTADSRKMYLPIEGVYAVLEVKQSLTLRPLDDAMRKLVSCHRLFRPSAPRDRLVENDDRNACTHYISNPLFSAVVAADLGPKLHLDEVVERFVRINQILPRMDVVRALCILGHGLVVWLYQPDTCDEKGGVDGLLPATFMSEDRFLELIPAYGATDADDSPLHGLMAVLMAHLMDSVLAPDGIAVHYGDRFNFRVPGAPGATLLPDPDLQASLDDTCIGKDRSVDSAYHPRQSSPGPRSGA